MATQLRNNDEALHESPALPIVVELDESERQVLGDLVGKLMVDPNVRIDDDPDWVGAARDLSNQLPLRLRGIIRQFRRDPGPDGTLLIRGLPVGSDTLPPTPNDSGSVERYPTLSAAAIMLVSGQFGEVGAFRQEKFGALVQNIVPVAGNEGYQGNEGSTTLKMHVEDGYHVHRPDYVGLLCLRNDHDNVAGLRTSCVRRALPLISASDRTILGEPRYITHAPASFGDGLPPASLEPVLSGDLRDPNIQIDFACTQPQDVAAAAAMDALSRALDEVSRTFVLEPGDLAVLDNRMTLHGRTAFRPRYDGGDRWLQRSFMHVDARRTRPVREADGNVLS
jgi:L-asparagine oxygenase